MFPYSMAIFSTPLFLILIIWSMIWKGIGLWKAGRNNQLAWFIVLLLLNTAGILPIIYIVWFQKKKQETIILPKILPKIKKKITVKKKQAKKKTKKK